MSTLGEFICVADHIRAEGNDRVIMYERGILTFESYEKYFRYFLYRIIITPDGFAGSIGSEPLS